MGFLLVYYFVFWTLCKLKEHFKLQDSSVLLIMFLFSVCWMVIDSVFFASPSMPELRARQMAAFPLGIFVAMNKETVSLKLESLSKERAVLFSIPLILVGGGITVLAKICESYFPYIIADIVSMMSVMSLGFVVVVLSHKIIFLGQNQALRKTGDISFMLYMVHAFTLSMLNGKWYCSVLFLIVTFTIAYIVNASVYRWVKAKA